MFLTAPTCTFLDAVMWHLLKRVCYCQYNAVKLYNSREQFSYVVIPVIASSVLCQVQALNKFILLTKINGSFPLFSNTVC